MRIIIDLQGAQTESRFGEIGRHSLSLAQAIARNRGGHEVIVVLNGLLTGTVEPVRAAFDGLLPQGSIRVWYAPGPVRESQGGNRPRRDAAERIREAFIAGLQPDVVHVSSLFEGYLDDAVTSVGVIAPDVRTVVMLYDCFMDAAACIQANPSYEQFYLRKVEHLKRASAWLSMLEATARKALDRLGAPQGAVASIGGVSDPLLLQSAISSLDAEDLRRRFGLTKPFIICPRRADETEDTHRLVRAYATLSSDLRRAHQLALVGKMSEREVEFLRAAACSYGLGQGELVFTGDVTDIERAKLHRLCKLMVVPSGHEVTTPTALEAISCVVLPIGALTSSLTGGTCRDDGALDLPPTQSIAERLTKALTDEAFRAGLVHGTAEQSPIALWDRTARRAIDVFEQFDRERIGRRVRSPQQRPTLAFVSPLPPERSGIADYSAELLPELFRHYDIEVVVAQERVTDPWVWANCPVRTPAWLRANSQKFDRVLYHFGNSLFHQHMFALLKDVPGTVVLHDFFLGDVLANLEFNGIEPRVWTDELYHSHGYPALLNRFRTKDLNESILKYPLNLGVLQNAIGVIVHSDHPRRLAELWYGEGIADRWAVIPLLRVPRAIDRAKAREALGLKADDFIVCSFGFVAPSKLNHRLLAAWLASVLAGNQRCVLVFAGDIADDHYGLELRQTIRNARLDDRVRITGWLDTASYHRYLAAADVAVQLRMRSRSRGETSAAVLDCMNYALPTIVNASGSLAEIPGDATWMLPDEFEDSQLVSALEVLWEDGLRRAGLGERAKQVILTRHSPRVCAEQYCAAIETFYRGVRFGSNGIIEAVTSIEDYRPSDAECVTLAESIAQNVQVRTPLGQLFVDVSVICRNDLRTGIERVVRSLLLALMESTPVGYRVEPVYLTAEGGRWHYRYARRYTLELLGCPNIDLPDDPIDFGNGDIVLGTHIDGRALVHAEVAGLYARLRDVGVSVHFIVYDLLPILLPQMFPPGADACHAEWLETITRFDGALCISRTVAGELTDWMNLKRPNRCRPFGIGWFDMGADTEAVAPTRGLPDDAAETLGRLAERPTFLMVGTVEPRKGHLQVVEALSQLWQRSIDVNLVIVGNEGWRALPDEARRSIPQIVERLRNHPERSRRLFWLQGISDEYLEKVYLRSTCLIAASENEGYGLPLIEAAQHDLPIIARDIPVFREVAGDNAFYFDGSEPDRLAAAISDWLALDRQNAAPSSAQLAGKRWADSARQVIDLVLQHRWQRYWPSPSSSESAGCKDLKIQEGLCETQNC
jgi:glycosyltransferase involved in cell wall biosynthesis